MLFEAEVIPMFIWGVGIVSILELGIGCWLLRREKSVVALFIGNVFSMALAMVFLILCVFGNRLGFVHEYSSPSNSVNIGLFGVFWTVSIGFLLAILSSKTRKP